MPCPTTTQECRDACLKYHIPLHMWEGMTNYFINHAEAGDFLRLIISNNYYDAASHADSTNQYCLLEYIKYIYNCAPPGSHGSPEAYKAWIKHHETP